MEPKDKILAGAEELFFKYGIKNITMDEVARHLGMSKKTLYQYFKDKDELIHQLMMQKIDHEKCLFKDTCEQAENVVAEMFAIMKNMREMLTKMNPVIFYELYKYYPASWKLFDTFKHSFIQEQLERSLKKGQEDGLVRKDINLKILCRMRLENIDMGFFGKVFPSDKYDLVDVQLTMTEHFLYGICTLKGYKLINKYKNITEE